MGDDREPTLAPSRRVGGRDAVDLLSIVDLYRRLSPHGQIRVGPLLHR